VAVPEQYAHVDFSARRIKRCILFLSELHASDVFYFSPVFVNENYRINGPSLCRERINNARWCGCTTKRANVCENDNGSRRGICLVIRTNSRFSVTCRSRSQTNGTCRVKKRKAKKLIHFRGRKCINDRKRVRANTPGAVQ